MDDDKQCSCGPDCHCDEEKCDCCDGNDETCPCDCHQKEKKDEVEE